MKCGERSVKVCEKIVKWQWKGSEGIVTNLIGIDESGVTDRWKSRLKCDLMGKLKWTRNYTWKPR